MADGDRPRSAPPAGDAILVINSGSSSVKFALFAGEDHLGRLWSGAIERVGLRNSRFHVVDAEGVIILDETRHVADHEGALTLLLEWIDAQALSPLLRAVGHRIVHGGAECVCPLIVTPPVELRLRELIPLAPLHQPHNLAGIAAVRGARPSLLRLPASTPPFIAVCRGLQR